MSLQSLIQEIFDDTGESLYNELAKPNRQRLTEALILQDDSEISEVLLRISSNYPNYHALIFSQMAGSENCDLADFRHSFRNAATAYYADQIQDEMDRLWPAYESEKQQCQVEADADAYREAV